MVAVAAAAGGGAIENNGHVVELLLLVVTLDYGDHVAVHQAGTDDKHGHVGPFGYHTGVGNNVDWRTVEEDDVVLLAQIGDELLQART